MSNYITEAFKAMNLLESEDITLNSDGAEELEGFLSEAGVDPDEEMIDVYDLETEAQDELKDSYIGKVVLECSVCHSDIFVDKADISTDVDEEGLACKDIECPYCMSNEGYTIIGEVAPFNAEESEELINPEEEETAEELPEVDVEGGADDVDEEDLEESVEEEKMDESLTEGCGSEEIEESLTEEVEEEKPEEELEEGMKCDGVEELYKDQQLRGVDGLKGEPELEGSDEIRGPIHKTHVNEEIESASIDTGDETLNISENPEGGIVVETIPNEGEVIGDDLESGEEMIVPLGSESVDEIEAAADANSVEEGEDNIDYEEIAAEEEFPMEDDFEDFDEESFNGLGESYLKSCYENVAGFKTTGVSTENNKLMIEGVIKFDSGNIKETNFVFESVDKNKYEGYNQQISRGKKTFKLNTSIANKKLVCESLNYNYRSKNEDDESVRVYGTVKRK